MIKLVVDNLKFLNSTEKKKLFLIVLISIIVLSMDILMAALVYPLIQQLINPGNEIIFGNISYLNKFVILDNELNATLLILILILIAIITKTIIYFLNVFFQQRTLEKINIRLSKKLYKQYLDTEWIEVSKKDIPTILRNVHAQLVHYVSKNLSSIINLISDLFLIFGLAFLLIYIEPLASILAIIFLFLTAGSLNLISKSYNFRFSKTQAKQSKKINKHVIQSFRALRNIKILNIEKNFFEHFSNILFFEIRARANQGIIKSLPRGILELLGVLTIVTIVIVLYFSGTEFEDLVSYIGLFFVSVTKLLPATNRILLHLQALRFGQASVDIFDTEFNSKNEKKEQTLQKNIAEFNEDFKSLQFNNVSFSYEEKKPVLNDLNFEMLKGQILGISGESGKGKSTLLDIISGLLEKKSGEILINNKSNVLLSKGWQRKIGFVFQDTYLLDDSLKKNIALGYDEKNIEIERIDYAIKNSDLKDFVKSLDGGINYRFGDIEQRLSGGQKQRIGIARALYNKPEILILDEATSALDLETEEKILSILKNLKSQCSIIIVSHKKNTLKICDKIIEL